MEDVLLEGKRDRACSPLRSASDVAPATPSEGRVVASESLTYTGSGGSWSTRSLELDGDFALEAPARVSSAPRRGSRKLTEYLSWPRSIAVRESLFSELEGSDGPPHSCVLDPDASFSQVWNALVTCLTLTHVALLTPLLIAFDAPLRVRPPARWSAILDFAVGAVFAADVLVQLRTAVLVCSDVLGRRKLVWKPSDIVRVYVRSGTFAYDILAVIPFLAQCVLLIEVRSRNDSRNTDLMPSDVPSRTALRLLRLLRLARLRKYLFGATVNAAEAFFSRTTDIPPLTLYVLQTAYEFSVLVNFVACAFVYVAHLEGYENSWLASVEDLGSRLDEFETYVAAVYFATATVSTVGFGDVSATTTAERIVATLSMTLGATYYAYLVGSVATLVERFGAAHGRRAAFREKMVELRAFLTRHPDVPRELRARIAAYFADAWLRTKHLGQGPGGRHSDDDALLAALPDGLRVETRFRVAEPHLRRVFPRASERALRAVAERLERRSIARGACVTVSGRAMNDERKRGDERDDNDEAPPPSFFLVVEGDVRVEHRGGSFEPAAVRDTSISRRVCGGGAFSYFGEEAFAEDTGEATRTHAAPFAVAMSACEVYELSPPEEARRLLRAFPQLTAGAIEAAASAAKAAADAGDSDEAVTRARAAKLLAGR